MQAGAAECSLAVILSSLINKGSLTIQQITGVKCGRVLGSSRCLGEGEERRKHKWGCSRPQSDAHERVRDPHCPTMGGLFTEMAVECLAAGLPRPQHQRSSPSFQAPGPACLGGWKERGDWGGGGVDHFGPAAAAGFPTLSASVFEIQKAETVKPPR